MRLHKRWLHRVLILGAPCLALLLSVVAWGEIRITTEPAPSAEAAELAQRVRSDLSRISVRYGALDVRIAIGAVAFRQALATNDGQPIIAVALTSTEFDAALRGRTRPPQITAVFSNPQPIDQINLARELLNRSAIGVFDSPAAHTLVTRITDTDIRKIPISADQGTERLLQAADALDVVVVLPDSSVMSSDNVGYIVRALYHRRKVLIGYSATLTRIGALASVYVRPEAISQNVATVAEQYATSGTMPNPVFVQDVDVAFNERLARSLNIPLPNRTQVLSAIRAKRQEAVP